MDGTKQGPPQNRVILTLLLLLSLVCVYNYLCESPREYEAGFHSNARLKYGHLFHLCVWFRRMKRLYQDLGNKADQLREILGIVANEGDPAFNPAALDAWQEMPPVPITWTPDVIFLSLDPNGNGGSEVGIVSAAFYHQVSYVSAREPNMTNK